MKFADLIKDLSSDTKQYVEDAKNKYNAYLRDAIRFETRFSLVSGTENSMPSEQQQKSSYVKVPIKVDVCYPDHLKNFEIPKEFEIAALLSQIRPSLKDLITSSEVTSGFIEHYQGDPQILNYCDGNICRAGGEAKELLAIADRYDLAKELLKIDSNILGCYTYNPVRNQSLFSGNEMAANSSISLFWGSIGLVAKILGVEIQELTAVVLAHELAHAYTHLGYDIDGNRWRDDSWQYSDPGVIEGLAQYYTERVLQRLSNKVSGGYQTYETLLEKQPEDYTTHKVWINDIKADPEAVRLTVISLRKGRPIGLSDFNDTLRRNTQSIRDR
ncbi:MAG: hypothetical protein KKD44_08980 [Proteobacteria bacterium]|nr:hypothetical protein [Pseudomonadota bacterium]